MLGTQPADSEIRKTYLKDKDNAARIKTGLRPLTEKEHQEEVNAIDVVNLPEDDKQKTVFPRNAQGQPCLWTYMIRGFFKADCAAYRRDKSATNKTKSKKLSAYKKVIDQNVFVYPDVNYKTGRLILIQFTGEIGSC